MRNPFRRRGEGVDTRAEQLRAARLDDALSEWQRGDVAAESVTIDEHDADLSREPFGDELATAQRLHAYAEAGRPAPHEPLVALRAAIAARRAARRPAWRGVLVSNRLGPALAAVALVVGTLVGLNLVQPGSSPHGQTAQEKPIAFLTEQAQQKLDRLKTVITQPDVSTEAVVQAYGDAYAAVQQATDALNAAAPSAGQSANPDVKALAAQNKLQQQTIDQLRQALAKAKLLVPPVVSTIVGLLPSATSTTDTASPTTSSATATATGGSSTTRPSTSTTRSQPTTTTAAPTTTEAPTTTTSTTLPAPTTTTPPPGDVGPASGTETVGF